MKSSMALVVCTLCVHVGTTHALYTRDVVASKVSITWEKPAGYTDLMKNQQQDPQLKLKKLDKIWQVAAKQLPENYRLKVIVHDVDLAGDYRNAIMDTRYFSDVYYPKMNISYQVYDESGKLVIAAENLNIDDKAFLSRSTFKANSVEYYFEQKMLQNWVKAAVVKKLPEFKANS